MSYQISAFLGLLTTVLLRCSNSVAGIAEIKSDHIHSANRIINLVNLTYNNKLYINFVAIAS